MRLVTILLAVGMLLTTAVSGAEKSGVVDPGAIPLERISLERVTADGGRLDWSPDGTRIAFDRLGSDGLTDVWEMSAGNSDKAVCLTCRPTDLGLPEGRHIGQPAYHPGGEWLVMQVEREGHRNDSAHPHPGAGLYHDLWVLHRSTNRAYRLTEVSDGRWGRPKGGSLHPVFSHNGEKLLWTDMENGFPGLFGDWRMVLATFDASEMPPRLRDPQYLEPGKEGRWFETHGFGPDDSWIYFSGSVMGTGVLQSDIARLTLATGEFQRLTLSAGPKAGEPGSYEESAHFSSRFEAFSHLSSEAGRGREELWLASPDGSSRRQVTHFNEPGTSDHEVVDGLWSMPSDNAWNPHPPQGREQLLLYLQVDFNPLKNVSRRNEIFLIEFAREQTGEQEDPKDEAEEPPLPGEPTDESAGGGGEESVDKRVVEGEYGFHLDVAGPDLGMPDVVAHREGDVLFCQAGGAPKLQSPTIMGRPNPTAPVDRYPQAPDVVRLVAITEDSARKAFYQLALTVESKDGNAGGPFRFMAPNNYGLPAPQEVEFKEWGTFELQKLDQRENIIDSVSSSPLLQKSVKDLRGRYPECSGTVTIEYSTQCEIDPEANTSCLARCIGTFRCKNLIQTGPIKVLNPYGNPETTKMLPTSVHGSFDLPLLFATDDGRMYWRGNRVHEDEKPEDFPNWKSWRGLF